MEWFENGRVNLYIRKPVNLGRIKQLVSNGFFETHLIEDIKSLEQVLGTLRYKEAHYVFNTGQPLPRMKIDYFKKSHGFEINVGDRSHRRSVEVISRVPDWAETFQSSVEKLIETLNSGYENDLTKKREYIV